MSVALAAALYLHDLGSAPVALGGDEAHFGVQAHAIAARGRTLDGRVLPLFVHLSDPQGDPLTRDTKKRWYQPTLFYFTAITLKVLPFSEAAIRTPTALIGMLNVLLMYAVALRLFRNGLHAALASLVLMLTPAHLIFSRQATDYLCPLPFVLGWFWCLLGLLERRRASLAFGAGVILGVGCYSYIAAWVLMPALLMLTLIAQLLTRPSDLRAPILAALGFAVPVLALVPWLLAHPEMLRETLGRYPASDAAFRFNTLQDRVSVYWDYFNPSFLVLTGGASLTASTGRSGVFLWALVVFLPLGIYALLTRATTSVIGVLLIGGFLLAPVPAALLGERYMIQRALLVLPFGALIATFGVVHLSNHPRRAARIAAVLLLASMPLQFAWLYRDYLGDYKRRSEFYFDSSAFMDTSTFLMQDLSAQGTAIYLSRQLDDVTARWRFYLTVHHREDLLDRTRYFDGDGLDLGDAPHGTLIVLLEDGAKLAALAKTGKWAIASTAVRADGETGSVVLRKVS